MRFARHRRDSHGVGYFRTTPKTLRRGVSIPALLLALCAPSAALGQNEIVDREADERFKRGLELVKQGKAEEARLMFQEVYAISPSTKVLWNLALAELDSKHPLEGLRHLRLYADDPRGDAKKKTAIPGLIDQAFKLTGHIKIEAPAGASIRVDGQPVPTETKLTDPLDVMPGRHQLEMQSDGKTTQKIDVDAPAGVVVPARFEVPAAVAPTGTALLTQSVPPPTHAPSHDDSVPATGFWSARNTTAVIFGVGAVAAWGVGVGFGLSANSQQSSGDALRASLPAGSCANPANPQCAELHDANASQRSSATIATIGFIAGGVLTAATVGTLLLWRSPRAKERAVIVPAVAPGTAGLQLIGRF